MKEAEVDRKIVQIGSKEKDAINQLRSWRVNESYLGLLSDPERQQLDQVYKQRQEAKREQIELYNKEKKLKQNLINKERRELAKKSKQK